MKTPVTHLTRQARTTKDGKTVSKMIKIANGREGYVRTCENTMAITFFLWA